MSRIQIAVFLVNNLNDAKTVSTERDWRTFVPSLVQHLRSAGFDTQADALLAAHNHATFRVACAESASALYHLTY